MRPFSLLAAVLCLLVAGVSAPGALADGPFEPNETAAEAFGPLAGGSFSAALETPQDVDWYRFYAKRHRQVGVLATLDGRCSSKSGSVSVDLWDAEEAHGLPLAYLRLGYTRWPRRT